jgi:uncharacterized protein (DUF302 family)
MDRRIFVGLTGAAAASSLLPGTALAQTVPIEHTRITAGVTYDALVTAFEREVGHLDPKLTANLVRRKASWEEVKRTIDQVGGSHGLMVIFRADQGRITSLSGREKRCSLYLVGNPVIANDIIDIDPGAAFYVPFRVCLYDEGADRSVIAYDRPSSFLAALGRPELTPFGEMLDQKIDMVAGIVTRLD